MGHSSMRCPIEIPQRIDREGVPDIGWISHRVLALNGMGVRCPRCQDRSFHLWLKLGMMNDIQGVLKMGEGHWFASFLPILFLSLQKKNKLYEDGFKNQSERPNGCLW